MKLLLPLALILFLLLFVMHFQSRENAIDSRSPTVQINVPVNSLIGTWELQSAGSGGTTSDYFPPGNGNLIMFSYLEYQLLSGGKLTLKGSYSFESDTSGQCLIIYNTGDLSNDLVKIEAGKLILTSTNSDHATRVYVKRAE